jgi:hypothetical protein
MLFFVPFEEAKTAEAAENPTGEGPADEAPRYTELESADPEGGDPDAWDPEGWEFEDLGPEGLSSEDLAVTSEDWKFDEENPIDGLVRSVLRASPNFFDGASHGLEGNYVVLKEESGNIEVDGRVCRVRLMALRKDDGIYDRSLLLEFSPLDEEPFLIPLPEDIRGFESSFEMKNFVSPYKSEILLSVKDVNDQLRRLLILDVQ